MVHVVTAFSRWDFLPFYVEGMKDLGITWHPILLHEQIEAHPMAMAIFKKHDWIHVFDAGVLPYGQNPCKFKLNMFLVAADIIETDKYFFLNDDDWMDTSIIPKLDAMNDDVIFVSMKRGDNQLPGGHPICTLIASPEVHVGTIGVEQYVLKGKIMKQIRFRTDSDLSTGYPPERQGDSDGHLAEMLMKLFPIRYEPDLFVYFNYLEPGRWNGVTI